MRRISAYIHEKAEWPNLAWSGAVLAAGLATVRYKQGLLQGRMESLGFELRCEAGVSTLTNEVVTSSAIEGEQLDPQEVRSSIARKLGLDAAGLPEPKRDVDGIVELMLDATRNFASPLTSERLFDWHAALFPTGHSGIGRITVGGWRTDESGPMQVVSGPMGREKVHFEAPAAGRLQQEMDRFIEWFNGVTPIDPVLKAGIAHFWFVTIHPFDDGNGRIARAIADMALARADGIKDRFYSMSAQIAAERKEYYRQLETAQRGDVDITLWLTWFLGCLERAIVSADLALASVLYKARLWQRINLRPVNDRQRLVINRMLEGFKDFLSTSKYAKLAKCSSDTALRDVQDLVDRGILRQNEGRGRSTSYRLADIDAVNE
jgi:Fic family protein